MGDSYLLVEEIKTRIQLMSEYNKGYCVLMFVV